MYIFFSSLLSFFLFSSPFSSSPFLCLSFPTVSLPSTPTHTVIISLTLLPGFKIAGGQARGGPGGKGKREKVYTDKRRRKESVRRVEEGLKPTLLQV